MSPLSLRLRGQRRLRDLDAALPRELLGACANEEDVRGSLHHEASKRDRVGDALDERHAASASVVRHDRGVERHHAVAVGARPKPNGHVGAVELHHAASRLDRVERGSVTSEHFQRPGVRRETVPPRGEDDGPGAGGRRLHRRQSVGNHTAIGLKHRGTGASLRTARERGQRDGTQSMAAREVEGGVHKGKSCRSLQHDLG